MLHFLHPLKNDIEEFDKLSKNESFINENILIEFLLVGTVFNTMSDVKFGLH